MNRSTDIYIILGLLSIAFLSFVLYYHFSLYVNPFSANSTAYNITYFSVILFWLSLTSIAFVVLRKRLWQLVGILHSWKWALVFGAYLLFHIVVYSVLLERIFVGASGDAPAVAGNHLIIYTVTSFYPHTPLNALIMMGENPGITAVIAPYYELPLSAYAFLSAFIIGMLVVLHLHFLHGAARAFRRRGMSVVYPAVGVAAGASCCISIPELVANYVAVSASLLSSALLFNSLLALYFLLPAVVIVSFAVSLPRMK